MREGLKSWLSKNHITILICFFIFIYHLFFVYSIQRPPIEISDSIEYLNSSKSFENDGNFYSGNNNLIVDYRHYSKRTPLYPLFLYGIRYLNIHINFVYLIQLFLGVINIFMAFKLLGQFAFKNLYGFIILAIFILFTPSQFIYSQVIMTDLWLQTFIMLILLSVAKLIKTKNSVWLFVLVMLSILAALLKPVFLMVSFIIGGFGMVYIFLYGGKKWLLPFMLLPFLSWHMLSTYNKKLTGVYHYSSIGYINLLHYNTQLFLIQKIGPTETEKKLGALTMVPHTISEFKNHYQLVNKECRLIIISHLGGYAIFHLKGMAYFFLDPGRFDIYNFLRIEEQNSAGFLHQGASGQKLKGMFRTQPFITLTLGFIFLVNIFKVFGFLGFVIKNRKNALAMVGALLVIYVALLTGPLGASRFALPVQLIIIAFSAMYYSSVFKKTKVVKAG